MKLKTRSLAGLFAMTGIATLAVVAGEVKQSQAAIITNGGFVPTGLTTSAYLGNGNITVDGWIFSNGYNFIVPDGLAATTNMSAFDNQPYGGLSLYSPGQTVNAPGGSGWFIAADGAFQQGPISQMLNGLTVGQQYNLTFSQAAGQQSGFTGATTDQWAVNLGGTFNGGTYGPNTVAFTGGTNLFSNVMSQASEAPVSGWTSQTLTFTATATSEMLNFLAEGTPVGQPPFALLSGVSVNAVSSTTVPEPFTIIGTLIGGTAALRLKKKIEDSSK
jgi:hypothetical protein